MKNFHHLNNFYQKIFLIDWRIHPKIHYNHLQNLNFYVLMINHLLHSIRHHFIAIDHFRFYLFFSFQFFLNCSNYFNALALISLQESKYYHLEVSLRSKSLSKISLGFLLLKHFNSSTYVHY